ncbi:hypothetical protein [Halomonas elongata]|uniref:hypothetical protein n=1 Tax=Halomonas elongata TaxID=2746 RepID=UPI00186B9B80|nr:hypothetical protein [Halomonas elongata]MBW5801154.1 hypothetical protein [Halomonas elongata]
MDKQEWIDRAYARFIERGVEADEKTRHWAELCWEAEQEIGFELSPEDAVDEELMAAAESQ